MTARALLFCMAFALAEPALAAEPDVSARRVEVSGESVFEVEASGVVKAAPAAVWKVLTDYESMPEFVPDMEKARIISRTGNVAILEQSGVARFMFVRRSIHLVVQVRETPMSVIDISLITGDMKAYECHWKLTALPEGGTRIDYSGKMVPKFYVPGMIGSGMIRRDITRMMKAVLDRLDQPPTDKPVRPALSHQPG